MISRRAIFVFAALCGLGVAACGGSSVPLTSGSNSPNPPAPNSGNPYHHIVVVIQENRSFDNMFSGAKSSGMLVPNVETTTSGYNESCANANDPATCQQVALTPLGFESPFDPNHSYASLSQECHFASPTPAPNPNASPCLMNGFGAADGAQSYSYLPGTEIAPYIQLANSYGIADHFFSGGLTPSFPGHVFLVAGLAPADNPPNAPWGCPEAASDRVQLFTFGQVQPCFTFPSIATELDQAAISWKYYTGASPPSGWDGLVNGFAAVSAIYNSSEYPLKVVPRAQFFSDVASTRGCGLPRVSWITPDGNASDHPGVDNSSDGPFWVGTIYESIAQSPCYADTAMLVVWDDSGGWFDHVPPPYQLTPAPPGFAGFRDIVVGMRVPLLFIAPNAVVGVSKKPRDFGAVLAFIEHDFSLQPLGGEDLDFGGDALSDLWQPNPTVTISPIPQSRLLSSAQRLYNVKYFLSQPETAPDNE
ncbi:MAG TPA: alkaline phosphatase family protein [Candidatus Rubrimentiphilum sp.]|nr:alkaline phosphatase family protein [Candidatus Rubrimentiphilum sp.]